MTLSIDARLEARLREAAASATWPPTPDLCSHVLHRLEIVTPTPPAAGSPQLAGRRRPVRIAGALALALIAALALAGIAGALGIRLPGIDILLVDHLPPAGAGLDLGSPIAIEDALAIDRPRVLAPRLLPRPEQAYSLSTGPARIVTLAYRAKGGQPVLEGSDLALTVMAVPGDTDEVFLGKRLGPGTTIERVIVDGVPGWWIAGAPHEILIRRPDSTTGVLTSALAGDTLVFARDGTLYRLESALGRDATIAIADSMLGQPGS